MFTVDSLYKDNIYVITDYCHFVFRPGWLQDLSYMGSFGPGRWAVSHAGNGFVLNEGLQTKSCSWNDQKSGKNRPTVNTMPNRRFCVWTKDWRRLPKATEGLSKVEQKWVVEGFCGLLSKHGWRVDEGCFVGFRCLFWKAKAQHLSVDVLCPSTCSNWTSCHHCIRFLYCRCRPKGFFDFYSFWFLYIGILLRLVLNYAHKLWLS